MARGRMWLWGWKGCRARTDLPFQWTRFSMFTVRLFQGCTVIDGGEGRTISIQDLPRHFRTVVDIGGGLPHRTPSEFRCGVFSRTEHFEIFGRRDGDLGSEE